MCEPEVLGAIGQFGSEKLPILRLFFFFNMYHVQNRQYSDAYVPIVARNRLGRRSKVDYMWIREQVYCTEYNGSLRKIQFQKCREYTWIAVDHEGVKCS